MQHKKGLVIDITSILKAEQIITETMMKNGLMVTVIEGRPERWIYHKGRFYCRDSPTGVNFGELWQMLAEDKNFRLYVFIEGIIMLDISRERLLIME